MWNIMNRIAIKLNIIIKTILSVLNRGKWYILGYIGVSVLY